MLRRKACCKVNMAQFSKLGPDPWLLNLWSQNKVCVVGEDKNNNNNNDKVLNKDENLTYRCLKDG